MRSGPPDKLNARHKRIAFLEARGLEAKDIARTMRCDVSMLTRLRKVPEYLQLVEMHQRDIAAKETFNIVKATSEIGKEVFDRKRFLMNQSDNLTVSNNAADSFFDRLYPKKTVSERDTTVRVSVTLEQAAHLRDVLAEDGVLDAEFDDLDDVPALPEPDEGSNAA